MMTKGWPRGGGIHDQDPMLVLHFRVIREFERQWKESQDAIQNAESGGGEGPLGSALDQYIKQLEEEGESSTL